MNTNAKKLEQILLIKSKIEEKVKRFNNCWSSLKNSEWQLKDIQFEVDHYTEQVNKLADEIKMLEMDLKELKK